MRYHMHVGRHARLGLDRPQYGLRTLSGLLFACAIVCGLIWEVTR